MAFSPNIIFSLCNYESSVEILKNKDLALSSFETVVFEKFIDLL